LLADDLALCGGQRAENVDRPSTEGHSDPVSGQLALAKIEPESAKIDAVVSHQVERAIAEDSERLSR
jgi:hypothetical protein